MTSLFILRSNQKASVRKKVVKDICRIMANITEAVTIDDLERHAAAHLDKRAFDYYSTGAGDDVTLRENRQAFNR